MYPVSLDNKVRIKHGQAHLLRCPKLIHIYNNNNNNNNNNNFKKL